MSPSTAPRAADTPNIVAVRNIDKRYAGVHALKRASLEIRPGEVHALMGENGAGKSTLARVIAGITPADSGDILVDGRPVLIASPRDAQRLGIGIIYQELDLFPHLTLGENIVIGNARFPERGWVHRRQIEQFCRPFLQQVGLPMDTTVPMVSLSLAQQQLLAIARALSLHARLLIMDEPTSSLPQDAVERLFGLIAELKRRGTGIVYVSHKMEEIFRISDRLTVMRDGEVIGTRSAAETDTGEVIRMMVGRTVSVSVRSQRPEPGQLLMTVQGLTTRKLRDVSFELRTGEVLGIAGLVGAGRSELGAALFGLDRILRGDVRIRGRAFVPRHPAQALQRGVGLLPEDRKLQGLMPGMSVRENGTLSILARLSRAGFIQRQRERALLQPLAGQLALRCASQDVAVGTLSGGNQQKALLARLLLADPDILFLDDPARGIDVGAKEDIYRLIDELAARGKGILLVSSELPELLRCADRILVLNQGQVARLFGAHEATQEGVIAAATAALLSRPAASVLP